MDMVMGNALSPASRELSHGESLWARANPKPLPMGEVARRRRDGEGKPLVGNHSIPNNSLINSPPLFFPARMDTPSFSDSSAGVISSRNMASSARRVFSGMMS